MKKTWFAYFYSVYSMRIMIPFVELLFCGTHYDECLVVNSQCQNSISYLSILLFSSSFGRSIRNESDCYLPRIGIPNKPITKPCIRANYQFKHHF